jgi:Tfp pilus assembly protein PilO
MKQSTKRLASIALSMAFIIGALIVYFDLTKPTFDEIQMVRGDQANREQILQMQDNAVKQVKTLLGTYQEQAALQSAVTAALPLKSDVSTVLSHLAAISVANRIQLQAIALLPSTVESARKAGLVAGSSSSSAPLASPVSSFLLQIKGTGTYEDFKLFAKDLENNVRIMDVKDVLISPAGKADQDLYLYDIRLKVYFQNVPDFGAIATSTQNP